MSNKKLLIQKFEIKEVLPCITTPGYIRFIALADNRLDDVIPIIFIQTPPGKANYIINENTITLRMLDRNVTLYPSGKVSVTNTPDINEANKFLEILKDLINKAYEYYLKYGKPSKKEIENIKKKSWTDLYKFLPKLNCGKCGFPICSSFAVSVFQGDSKLSECTPLLDPKFATNLEKLVNHFGRMFLASLGLDLISEKNNIKK